MHTTTDEPSDSDRDDPADDLPDSVPDDPADVADADAFEQVLCSDFTAPNPNPPSADGNLEALEDVTEQTIDQMELDDLPDIVDQETASGVIIDQFPFGSPGSPIPGSSRGLSAYEALREMHTDNPWAPFSSQLDWEVARWAKMRSPSSTAVTELLAIPGVRVSYSWNTMHLI